MSMDLLTGALGSLISKLGELIKDEYKLLKSVPVEIESLIKELECAHAAVRKVGRVPADQLDEQVKLWARELREASYDMEDVLDTFLLGNEGDQERSDHGSLLQRLLDKAGGLVSMISNQYKRRKIAGTVNDINERISEVTQRYGRYTVDSIAVTGSALMSTVDPRLAAMYKEVSQLIGINKSSSELICRVSPQGDGESEKKMKIISVVGVGGLGKTTLAKVVSDKLKGGFDVSAFVPVGREPDLKKVFRDVLIELDKNKYLDPKMTILDERQLINEIREYLADKRYFIVIDDVWETKSWETIKLALDENNNGSRLITTTRISDVAIQAGEVYKLKPLPSDQSKKLFYTRIFGANGTCPDSQLDEVSEKILKKCDGVPLAIITMASLLVGKSGEEWIEVCTSVFRDKGNHQVSDTEWILSLSYYDLPDHLKTCLLYLSAFPEDCLIYKNSLIQKWIAEGFVNNKPGTRLFEVGEGYFNELVNRSMIMAVESEKDGTIYNCRVHDMVLDLIRVKSQEENFVRISGTNDEGTSSPSTIRRLSHQNRTVEQTHQDTQMDPLRVRTFIAWSCGIVDTGLSFLSFKLLRVLALENCGDWNQNPPTHLNHLESLLHLRYLGLRRTWIRELPEEIGALKFLQTLDLGMTSVEELPYSVRLLTQLIYLNAPKVPNGVIEKLTSLEQLQIRVDKDTVGQFVKDLGKLHELRLLRVYFNSNWNWTKETMESDFAFLKKMESDFVVSLGNLNKLRHLNLYGSGFLCLTNDVWDRAVLPRPLQYLALDNPFSALATCINPSGLPNLSYLRLTVKNMDEQGLKILGRLPELRYLFLETDSTVTLSIQATDDCFQQLTYLVVPRSMPQFALNEDSSVSLTIWNVEDNIASGSKTRDNCIVAPAVMQNLGLLHFVVPVEALSRNSGENLGLEYLPSLKKIKVRLRGSDDVEKEEAALRHAIQAHPNRSTLQIEFL